MDHENPFAYEHPQSVEGLRHAYLRAHSFQEVLWAFEPWLHQDMHYGSFTDTDGVVVDVSKLIAFVAQLEIADGQGDLALLEYNLPDLYEKLQLLNRARKAIREIYELPHRIEQPGELPLEVFALDAQDPRLAASIEPSGDTVPVVCIPGLSDSLIPMRRLSLSIAEHGRSVMTVKKPQANEIVDPSYGIAEGMPRYVQENASAALTGINYGISNIFGENQIDRPRVVDAIGYSFGAITTVAAALAQPEKFRSIILLNPSGISDAEMTPLLRFGKLARDTIRAQSAHARFAQVSERATHFFQEMKQETASADHQGGLTVALKTAEAISQVNLVPLLEELESKGVRVIVVPAQDDSLFKLDDILRRFKHPDTPPGESNISAYELAGPHINHILSSGAVGALLNDILEEVYTETKDTKRLRE
jgi:pimeloyl-ACP methyl ester carboxylesterase